MHRIGQQRRKTKWAYKKTLYRIIWNTPNAEIPRSNFSILSNPLVLSNRILRGWPFIFQDNKPDHLRVKELFTTTKPQKPVKLTIGNSQLCSNQGTGMITRHLHTLVEKVCQRYHRIYLENFGSQQDPRKLQEKLLEVQLKLKRCFCAKMYMPIFLDRSIRLSLLSLHLLNVKRGHPVFSLNCILTQRVRTPIRSPFKFPPTHSVHKIQQVCQVCTAVFMTCAS
jgi:hypothetical protein